jgi:hypothetical protein
MFEPQLSIPEPVYCDPNQVTMQEAIDFQKEIEGVDTSHITHDPSLDCRISVLRNFAVLHLSLEICGGTFSMEKIEEWMRETKSIFNYFKPVTVADRNWKEIRAWMKVVTQHRRHPIDERLWN